jgi:hypothetical protein
MVAQLQAERAQASPQLAQPERSNMGGQGMTTNLQNQPPAASGWSVQVIR